MWFFLKEILLPLFLIILLISLALFSLVFVTLALIQLIKDIILEFTDSCSSNNDNDSDTLSDAEIKSIHDKVFNSED